MKFKAYIAKIKIPRIFMMNDESDTVSVSTEDTASISSCDSDGWKPYDPSEPTRKSQPSVTSTYISDKTEDCYESVDYLEYSDPYEQSDIDYPICSYDHDPYDYNFENDCDSTEESDSIKDGCTVKRHCSCKCCRDSSNSHCGNDQKQDFFSSTMLIEIDKKKIKNYEP